MIGIVAYTNRPFKGIQTLSERYKLALPNSEIISVDDPEHPYFIKKYDLLFSHFSSAIFIEHYFDLEFVKKFPGKKFLVPMWEYIMAARPAFPYFTATICHSAKAKQIASIIGCPNYLVGYPMIDLSDNDDKGVIDSYFMINGHPANDRKRCDLLNIANADQKYKLDIYTIAPLIRDFANINPIVGFVQDKKELYKKGKMQIYPSTLEGLGMSIYESLEYGVPVAIADLPPANEGFNKDLLMYPGRADSIRNTMDKFNGKNCNIFKEWIAEFIDARSLEKFSKFIESVI